MAMETCFRLLFRPHRYPSKSRVVSSLVQCSTAPNLPPECSVLSTNARHIAGGLRGDIGLGTRLFSIPQAHTTILPTSTNHPSQFPYSLQALPATLSTQWDSPAFLPYRSTFPAEHASSPSAFSAHVHDLTSRDLKIPYLKSLQGYLWLQGYESGALKCPIFPDVAPTLAAWHASGLPIIIYSSGSVAAQKLLFQYTDCTPEANLRPLLADYFDTVNAGPKTEAASYEKIAATRPGVEMRGWLFLSDNPREVSAAKEAGMQAFVVVREGNAPLSEEDRKAHAVVESFDQVKIRGVKT